MTTPHWLPSILFLAYLSPSESQVLWYGDQRAYMNPASSQGFFDLTYVEHGCPSGIESNGIPKYAYFGPMVGAMRLENHGECLLRCLHNRRCVAINFFEPLRTQPGGYCELLAESQLDNPRQMRPFRHSTYYENIRCPDEIPEITDNPVYDKELPEQDTKPEKYSYFKQKQSKKSLKKLFDSNNIYRHRH